MFEFIIQPLMNLGNMLMQTSTGSTEIDSIVGIVLAVAAIAGVIGSFFKLFEKTHKYGVMMDTFSQKTVENEEMLRRVGSAVVETVPEIEPHLKKHGAELAYLEERINKGRGQLELTRDLALKLKDRASSTQMPRESKPVF